MKPLGGGELDKSEAEIKFSLEYINKQDIPYIKDYEKAINLIQNEKLTNLEKPIFSKIKNQLSQTKIPILFISDNGVGFNQERLISILSDGNSEKSDKNSSGSFGIGHISAFNASNLRFCLYGGKSNNEQICSMHAILHTFEENENLKSADGYLLTKDTALIEKNNNLPKNKEIPKLILDKLNKIKKNGSVVGIIGFNFFDKKPDELSNIIKSAVIKNFFVAIEEYNLKIKFTSEKENLEINKQNLRDEFDKIKDNDEPRNAKIFYDTYKNGDYYSIPTQGGEVDVYIEKKAKETKICICRNGMWITDKNIAKLRKNDFLENLPFNALILPVSNTKFAQLIKEAETELHDKIKVSNLLSDKQKELEQYLNQIGDFLRDTLPKNNIDKFDIHIDGLDIQMQGDTQKGSKNKSTQTMKSVVPNENIPTQNPLETEFEEKDGFSNTKSDFANLTKTENMKNFRSKHSQNRANIKFISHKNFNNLCLGIRVDNGTDPSCDNITYESKIKIKSAKNKNIELGVLSNKEAIRIGKVNKDESFELDIEFSQALQDCILHYDFYEQKESL